MLFSDEYWMQMALREAQYASENDEVPVGALIVFGSKILAKTYNTTERLKDVTAHAELLAITSAATALGGKYLKGCTLYVTLEPCVMRAGALYWSQISRVVIGAPDPKRGYRNAGLSLHPKTEVTVGVLETECGSIIKDFFKNKR